MKSPLEENASSIFCTTKENENLLSKPSDCYEEELKDNLVFSNKSQSIEIKALADISSFRTADVIDCVGENISSVNGKRHRFPSESSKLVYSATTMTTNIEKLNKSRRAELTIKSLDLSFNSSNAQSPVSSSKETFKLRTHNDEDSIDTQSTVITVESKSSILLNTDKLATTKESTYYNMDHEYRGIAVIINNDIFEGSAQSTSEQSGSLKDINDLQNIFFQMDFEVLIWNNLYNYELTDRLAKLAEKDHSKNDCLVVVVMTYGINSSFIYARENLYPVEFLWNTFTADKCSTLVGKPKMFFIQVCRGEKLDCGIIRRRESFTKVRPPSVSYAVPKHADFLIVFSTNDDYFSFRHPDNGTLFIQSLCFEMINNDLASIDILRIMTRVSRRVAFDHEFYNPEISKLLKQNQIPSIQSTLIRDVYFKPKMIPPPKPVFFEIMMESSQDENVSLNFCSTSKEEDLLSESAGFYEEEFDDDEVFLSDFQSLEMEASSDIPPRTRRTSDVIDCVGETTPSTRIKRHSFPSTSGEIYSATSRATNIRDLNRSRRSELTTESLDLGYSSPGAQSAQSSARSLKGTWFRFSSSNDADAIDARPTSERAEFETSSRSYMKSSSVNKSLTIMPVAKDATCYNMDHEYRGIAVIINNDIFEGTAASLPDRNGSLKDVIDLQTTLYNLDFEVLVWNNLYYDEIIYRLTKLAEEDHSKNDCLVVVAMTHGISSSFIYARENPYPVEFLWNTFTADKCPTLAGKPKLFFIQACRGEKLDCGITLSRETTEVDSSTAAYKIPKHADFLISFSTYDGYYSFRHPENGTWFIQSLCLEINRNDLSSIDILRIMTRVSRRVALDYESFNPEKTWLHKQKQIPTIHTTLIRDLFFKPNKKRQAPEPVVFECLVTKSMKVP